jgi:hypothetical protein
MTDSPYVPGAGIALPREPFLLLPDFAASRRRTCSTRMSRNSTSSRSRAMSASAPTESMSAQYAPKTAHIVNRRVGVVDAPRIGSTRRLRSDVLSATERAYARLSIAPAPTRSTSSCYPSSGSTGARAAGRSGGYRLAGLVEHLGASLPTEPPGSRIYGRRTPALADLDHGAAIARLTSRTPHLTPCAIATKRQTPLAQLLLMARRFGCLDQRIPRDCGHCSSRHKGTRPQS